MAVDTAGKHDEIFRGRRGLHLDGRKDAVNHRVSAGVDSLVGVVNSRRRRTLLWTDGAAGEMRRGGGRRHNNDVCAQYN